MYSRNWLRIVDICSFPWKLKVHYTKEMMVVILSKGDLEALLSKYFFEDESISSFNDIVNDQRESLQDIFSQYLMSHVSELKDRSNKVIELMGIFFDEVEKMGSPMIIKKYIDKTSSYKAIAIFEKDDNTKANLKNLYAFDLIEKIRFAKLQKESLRDTSTYNRHIAKSLTEMRNYLIAFFELDCLYEEVEAILEKYMEFNMYVNTSKNWIEFYTLKEYEHFMTFLEKNKSVLIRGYEKGSLDFEAVREL